MDCRQSLRWGLGLLTGCLGCVSQQGPLPPGPVNPPVIAKKEPDLPKRNMKPETLVAFARYREGDGTDEKLPLPTRQRLLEEGRLAYQQAIKQDANYLPAYLGLAHLYITEEDYNRAFDTYHKAIQKRPQAPEAWYALGMCHARRKEWEPALAALKKAVELDPENREYTRTLGLCLARAGHSDESVACLTKVMNQAEAYFNVGRMLHHLHKEDEGKRYVQMALQVNPDLAVAREFLAYLENPTSLPATPPVVAVGFEEVR
jgi:tetratricopeptide (TPR) repeat protein